MQPRRYITQALALVLALGAWTVSPTGVAAQGVGQPGVSYQEAEEVAPALARQILGQRTATATSQGQPEGFAAQSFGTGGINAPANAEVIELARALRYDPDLIFEYVRDQIEFDPTYGAKRGAVGTILDGYGNAFDQAQLMIELLRASGFTAGYVLGDTLKARLVIVCDTEEQARDAKQAAHELLPDHREVSLCRAQAGAWGVN